MYKISMLRRQGMIRNRLSVTVGVIVIVMVLIFLFVDQAVTPTIIVMSEAKVRYITVSAMNEAVKEILGEGIIYTDLINVRVDNEGKIAMMQANTIKMNILATDTSRIAQEIIAAMGAEGILIPLGAIFGSELVAGLGPRINVEMIPIGAVATDFATEFQHAGINQTRHLIYLVMNAQVRIVVPLGSELISISTRVPVTETIIVGEVPQNYFNTDMMNEGFPLMPDMQLPDTGN
jgi:sporulation protein YunB